MTLLKSVSARLCAEALFAKLRLKINKRNTVRKSHAANPENSSGRS